MRFFDQTAAPGVVFSVLAFAGILRAATSDAVPAGAVLVPNDVAAFRPAVWVDDKSSATIEPVSVAGQPFAKALRLTTLKPSPQNWQIGVNAKTQGPIKKGDVLWVTFRSRRIQSRQETGEAVGEVVLMQKDAKGSEARPLERGFSCGPEWTATSLPFVAPLDADAGTAAIGIRFGSAIQSLDVGGVTLINCGPDADVNTLPRTATRYEGYAADAPWRAAAAARIEKIRKGDLAVRVMDAAGRPVEGAAVAVRMRRHAFAWGTAVTSKEIIDDQTSDGDRFRQTVEKYFNKVVFENELKWQPWIGQKPAERQRTLAAIDWFAARDIAVRGHVMVWPSWRNTPKFLRGLESKPDDVRTAVLDHIAEQTSALGDKLAEWDVINETFIHNDLLKLLGRDVMIDWFRKAHEGAPQVKLFYNDYVMFHGTTPTSPSQYFYDTAKFFLEKGAPISGLGEQGHFGGNPPGPAMIVAQLDRFGALGLPIQITEFDIDTPDEQLQADFTRDFTTAIFSHPAVTGMVQWGFWEKAHWKPSAALWRTDWTLRPGGQAWVDLVTKTWWTNADGQSAADGTYSTRGFYGEYDVTVTAGGRTKTTRTKLMPGAKVLQIELP